MEEITGLALILSQDSLQQTLQLGDFILRKADSLSEQELAVCLQAFANDASKLKEFEDITLANLQELSVEVVSAILYQYAKERRGSKTFITNLAERVELEIPEELKPQLVAQIIATLNLIGRKNTQAFKAFAKHAKQLDKASLSPEERAVMN